MTDETKKIETVNTDLDVVKISEVQTEKGTEKRFVAEHEGSDGLSVILAVSGSPANVDRCMQSLGIDSIGNLLKMSLTNPQTKLTEFDKKE